MSTADVCASAREAYELRAWGDAYRQLTVARADGVLHPADLERLATSCYLTGRLEQAATTWEHAHQGFTARGESAGAFRCGFWLGLTLLLSGQSARGGGWLARAARTVDDLAPERVEHGFLSVPEGLQALNGGEPAAAHTLFCDVVDIAERCADSELFALGRLGQGQSLIAIGRVADGVARLDDAMLTVMTAGVSPILAGIVYCAVIIACRDVFDLHRAHEWTRALTRWCADQPDLKPYRGQCLVHRSEIMQLRGEWSEALREARRACVHLADPPGDPLLGSALYQQGELLRLRGEFSGAEEAYREAAQWGHTVQPGLALLRLAQGRTSAAEAAIRRVVGEAAGLVERSRVLPAFVEITLAAERGEEGPRPARPGSSTVGEGSRPARAADELADIAAVFDAPYLHAVAAHARGQVLLADEDPTAAGRALRSAWKHWSQLEVPYEAARTRVLLGLAHRQLGDAEGAALEWEGARLVFEQLRAAHELRRLDDLCRSDRPTVAEPADGLTERQREILGLVSTGMSNRMIATDLVISEHTVRRHLQNIYAKLGLRSRAAATAYAYEHHLV